MVLLCRPQTYLCDTCWITLIDILCASAIFLGSCQFAQNGAPHVQHALERTLALVRGPSCIAGCPKCTAGCNSPQIPIQSSADGEDRANLTGLVLGCIEAKFCKKICVGKLSPRSTQCTPLHSFAISKICQNFCKF